MPARSTGRTRNRNRDPRASRFGPCKVIILAGGFGTRLAEHTDELPKPMVQVGGKPVLWHILKIYSHFGFNDFLIACGYRAELIKRFFIEYRQQMSDLVIDFTSDRVQRMNPKMEPWRVALIDTGAQTMTGGRIKRLADQLDRGTFLMTYGDGVANVDLNALLRFHRKHGKLATFTAVRQPSQFGVPTLRGDQVVRFAEKQASESDWVSGGFFALEPGVLKYIAGDQTNFELESLKRLAEDGQLMAYRHEGFWQPMDTLRDVRKLNSLWANADGSAPPPWKVWD
jgi:glucose-1-phosphate cytidylyltransferase